MKVKSLLKTFRGIDYYLIDRNGCQLEQGYVSILMGYDETSDYEDWKVERIEMLEEQLFITIKMR